jgi:regulator of replication initiation timing
MKAKARGQVPDSEIRLRKQIVKLKELRAKDATELSQLRTDVEHLVRIVNQLTVENRQLRGALSQPSIKVRALPTQPQSDRSL